MGRLADKHSSAHYSGSRSDVDLEVLTDDPSSSRIQVQCSVCQQRFEIGRSSLRNERMLARKIHCPEPPSGCTLTLPSAGVAEGAHSSAESPTMSVIVAGTGEGRRYLKEYCDVDDWILSVHRWLSDGTAMVYAKTIDQKYFQWYS